MKQLYFGSQSKTKLILSTFSPKQVSIQFWALSFRFRKLAGQRGQHLVTNFSMYVLPNQYTMSFCGCPKPIYVQSY